MKKKEAMMNYFNYCMTYILRCNTDVTSLSSGTMLKAVIVYVTDYITKQNLKTSNMFELVISVFERNTELLNSDSTRHEIARKLMNKIVNTMGVMLEIGAPFAALYLLGLSDHYTSHRFVQLNWRAFVSETRRCFLPADGSVPEKVTIKKIDSCYVGSSPVDDYRFRPVEYEDLSLFDWCRLARVSRKVSVAEEVNIRAGDESTLVEHSADLQQDNIDTEIDDNVDECEQIAEPASLIYRQKLKTFVEGHPLRAVKGVHCVRDDKTIVPCFAGGTLPRRDKDDHEFYCATMLTLFKPWHSGFSLKECSESWESAFKKHTFSDRQHQLMRNMNTQYECLDARDDYSVKLKAMKVKSEIPHWDAFEKARVDGDEQRIAHEFCDFEDDPRLNPKGTKSKSQDEQREDIVKKLCCAGWTPSDNTLQSVHEWTPVVNTDKTGKHWKAILNSERKRVVEREFPLPDSDNCNTTQQTSFTPNSVKIVNKSYLQNSFNLRDKKLQDIVENIQTEMSLNAAQCRAFKIATNHIGANDSEQLRMFISGMAGTGKTAVLRAIKRYFALRNESHRFAVIVPTGSAAAMIGGSTYHSLLDVNDFHLGGSLTTVAKTRQCLFEVDYIFLDEVSMISCKELYRIHNKLCQATNKTDVPFGGYNMIFAGDFAQLPPVIGGESAALYSGLQHVSAHVTGDQESTIGKALWHQVTTVVILRENMRQRNQSKEDDQLRTALSNMRY